MNEYTIKEFYPIAMKIINQRVSKDTEKDRIRRVERHIIPTLGNIKIKELSSLEIENWQFNLFKLRGSDQSKRCKTLLKNILNRAVVHEIIAVNPILGTATIRDARSDEREVYSKEEIKSILNNSSGWLRLFILTMVSLGLRSGEAIAIKFSDVNWRNRTIKIQRAFRKNRESKTKTGVSRNVDIPKDLYDELIAYQNKNPTREFIFVTPNGTPYKDSSYVVRRHFRPLLKELDIEYKSLYSLRHTYATISLQGGQTINYISKQLGHKDIKTTLEFYIKYLKDEEDIKRADSILSFWYKTDMI